MKRDKTDPWSWFNTTNQPVGLHQKRSRTPLSFPRPLLQSIAPLHDATSLRNMHIPWGQGSDWPEPCKANNLTPSRKQIHCYVYTHDTEVTLVPFNTGAKWNKHELSGPARLRRWVRGPATRSGPGSGTAPAALDWPGSSAACSPAPAESSSPSAPWSAPSAPPPPHAPRTSGDSSPGPAHTSRPARQRSTGVSGYPYFTIIGYRFYYTVTKTPLNNCSLNIINTLL